MSPASPGTSAGAKRSLSDSYCVLPTAFCLLSTAKYTLPAAGCKLYFVAPYEAVW